MGGDSIKVGDLNNNVGVAIGSDITVDVDQGQTTHNTLTINQTFETIHEQLEALPAQVESITPQVVADAQAEVEEIRPVVSGEQPLDESLLERKFRIIAGMGDDILDVITACLINPAAGISEVVRKIAQKAREEAELDAS